MGKRKDATEPPDENEVLPEPVVVKNPIEKSLELPGESVEIRRSLVPIATKETALGKIVPLVCDLCYAREKCPSFKPLQECVYIAATTQINTSADMVVVIKNLLAVQVQRINQMRVIENLDGGYADGTLSSEMDRFFEMARTLKEMSDTRDTIEIKAKGNGIISQIFGNLGGK